MCICLPAKMLRHLFSHWGFVNTHHAHSIMPDVCVHHLSLLSSPLMTENVSSRVLMSHLISASILGPVFGNQDQFFGLAIFLDTFRNDLHGMDVSLSCLAGGDWPACFFAGPVFSNNALFHGLAVFIDTYSNDDATDVSGGSGFTRQHAVSTQTHCSFSSLKVACCHEVLSMLTLKISQNLFCHIFT